VCCVRQDAILNPVLTQSGMSTYFSPFNFLKMLPAAAIDRQTDRQTTKQYHKQIVSPSYVTNQTRHLPEGEMSLLRRVVAALKMYCCCWWRRCRKNAICFLSTDFFVPQVGKLNQQRCVLCLVHLDTTGCIKTCHRHMRTATCLLAQVCRLNGRKYNSTVIRYSPSFVTLQSIQVVIDPFYFCFFCIFCFLSVFCGLHCFS
jgi:hypothetical protein